MTALEYKDPKYEQTHFIKQSLEKDLYNSLTEEERNNLPIIGGVKKLERKQVQATETAEYADSKEIDTESGLPF